MQQNTCKNCALYRQHYILNQKKIVQIFCGHCTYGRPKHKRPDAKGCDHYIPSAPTESSFVSKEYLSKALLEYMLNLDLLPKIYSIDTDENP